MKKLEEAFDAQKKDMDGVIKQVEELEAKNGRLGFGGNEAPKTIGEQFIDSEVFKTAQKNGDLKTGSFDVKSFYPNMYTKATIDSTVGGVLRNIYKVGGVFYDEQWLSIRDIMNVQTITAGQVEYIEETGFTNNANFQVEGAIKAESALTWAERVAPVRTLAHFIPATRQIMDDAPMLRNYIDNRLIYGLKVVEENAILYGAGTGASIEGLMINARVQDAGAPAGTDTALDHIRRALTRTRITGYGATGIILHPEDWEAIELLKGTDDRYLFVNVNDGGIMRLWRVPVIESIGMAPQDFLLGAFGRACQLLDREQANVRIAEEHADFFTRNMVAVLAEERLAMPVYRPEALVKGTLA